MHGMLETLPQPTIPGCCQFGLHLFAAHFAYGFSSSCIFVIPLFSFFSAETSCQVLIYVDVRGVLLCLRDRRY
jgi:hypothetical protein